MKIIDNIKFKIKLKKEERPYTYIELAKELEKSEREIDKLRCKINTANLKYEELINDKTLLLKALDELTKKEIVKMSSQCKKKKY